MKKYRAVSLVEMLITLIIITIVMILVSVTLTTMVRTSIISTAKTTSRQESEFILELLRKTVRNSHPNEIFVYNVSGRLYDEDTGITVDNSASGYETPLNDGIAGTEIHFRPYGYSRWVCIGYFPTLSSTDHGIILKSVRRDLDNPSECFDGQSVEYSSNTLVLNSEDIQINNLEIHYFSTQDENYIITIDLEVEPTKWLPNSDRIKPSYFQQVLVSTQKLTWED